MIYEYAVMAQIISFFMGFLLNKLITNIKELNFFNCLSEETLSRIHDDIQKNNKEEYDE
jgi:hypothetical protein